MKKRVFMYFVIVFALVFCCYVSSINTMLFSINNMLVTVSVLYLIVE